MSSVFVMKINMGNKTHITGVTFNALSDVTIEETINATLKYSQEGSRWEDYLVLTSAIIFWSMPPHRIEKNSCLTKIHLEESHHRLNFDNESIAAIIEILIPYYKSCFIKFTFSSKFLTPRWFLIIGKWNKRHQIHRVVHQRICCGHQ